MYKPLPIGIDDFKKIRENNYYYIDKTLFIKEILDKSSEVKLFTRPRRFGKTLALSMLRYFFEAGYDPDGCKVDNSSLFKGLKIMDAGENYTRRLCQYPVISLSLKSSKQPDFDMAFDAVVNEISKEFDRHNYVISGDILLPEEKDQYIRIRGKQASRIEYATALEFLTRCLKKVFRKNVIILLDEYDVPLENAYFKGFYEKMADFIRSLFESALKTNPNLEFAVITGCLRITKESIFTGLNNLQIISIMNKNYGEYFGFTQKEVESLLCDYGIGGKSEEVKQ